MTKGTISYAKKNDEGAKTGLLAPSNALLGLVEKFELEYNKIIDKVIHESGVKSNLISKLLQVKLGNLHCNECHVEHAVTRLYVQIRFHHLLNLYNKYLADNKDSEF